MHGGTVTGGVDDNRLVGECREGDLAAACQRMARGQDRHQPFGPEDGDLDGGVHRRACAQESQVVTASEQAVDQARD